MNLQAPYSPTRRAALFRLALAGVFGAGGMSGLLRAALAADSRPGIRSIKGRVSVDGRLASVGQQIQPGQKVETGVDGEAIFVIGEDAFLQRENSAFEIEAGKGVVALRYITGKMLSVFGKGRKQLVTPTATIGIRGTGCYIEAEETRTYFCLCYGAAVVQANADPGKKKVVRTRHHESPFYIGGAVPAAIRRAKVINHSDRELIMLEELVGRRPPFHGKGYKEVW